MKTVKILLSIILAVALILICSGCDDKTSDNDVNHTENRLEMYSQDEYVLYQNIFYRDYGKECDGTNVDKKGIFAIINDAYNNRLRYYVWGYYDQTKCCDWQWEFVPKEGDTLPPVGSLISLKGTFVSSKEALDGYWIVNVQLSTETEYSGIVCDIDMLSMSCTLERVQIYNIINRSETFQDRDFSAYARIASLNSFEDPYYNGSWHIEFAWDGDIPGIGTLVEIFGTVRDGKLLVRSMNKT